MQGRTNRQTNRDVHRREKHLAYVLLGALVVLGCTDGNGGNGAMEPSTVTARAARSLAASETPRFTERDLECLALNVYWEARSDGRDGQLAIAHVTMNRVRAPGFPDDVCSVVREGGYARRHRCQFSWWCDGRSDRPSDRKAWSAARALARDVLAGRTKDPTRGAMYFHRRDVSPAWASSMVRRCTVGAHLFYAEPRDA
jgi:spore germination cell wall hydrolase CwlJ-like protein